MPAPIPPSLIACTQLVIPELGREIAVSAHLIFMRDKTLDKRELTTSSKQASATLAGHEVKPLVFYGALEELEGTCTEGSAILEVPSIDAAKAGYNGPSYRTAREHRFNDATYRATLVQGV